MHTPISLFGRNGLAQYLAQSNDFPDEDIKVFPAGAVIGVGNVNDIPAFNALNPRGQDVLRCVLLCFEPCLHSPRYLFAHNTLYNQNWGN